MADVVLKEGPLKFTFQNVNFVERYENWGHYIDKFQNACGGSKAVDFVVVQGQNLWLIEVKNYRQSDETERPELEKLSKKIALKVKHTLAGLAHAALIAEDHHEKNSARRALACSSMQIVFHIEQPDYVTKLYPQIIDESNIFLSLKQAMGTIVDSNLKIISKESVDRLSGLQLSVQ